MATQIGAQMYTIRDHCKTPADIAKSCKKLADLGFGAVQVSAIGSIEVGELKKVLDDNGLVCGATHQSIEQLRDTERILDYHRVLDCELTAIGGFSAGHDPERWQVLADELSGIGKTLARRGLRVGYHNHSHELAPLTDDPARMNPKDIPLQLLIDELDRSVWFELDTYWIAHGGGDPAAWIERVSGRIPAVHVKDMTITPKRQPVMCEVGRGNLNWPAIIKICQSAGVMWYFIERDSGELDPFDSLKISLENLSEMGIH